MTMNEYKLIRSLDNNKSRNNHKTIIVIPQKKRTNFRHIKCKPKIIIL